MQKSKRLRKWIAEFYLIASVLYYWIMTGTVVNYIAIALLLVLVMLIGLKNPLLGTTISIVFLVLNLFLVLALISELKEFPAFNNEAKTMLFFGSVYLGVNVFVSMAMLLKWGKYISLAHDYK